jgi:hypothetical protein
MRTGGAFCVGLQRWRRWHPTSASSSALRACGVGPKTLGGQDVTLYQYMQKTFRVRVFMCARNILMAAVQPIRTVQDLQANAITTWVQPIKICLPAAQGVQGNSLKLTLRETDSEHPIPMPLFEYELELLFKEGTAAGVYRRTKMVV